MPTKGELASFVKIAGTLAGIWWASTKPDQQVRDNQHGVAAYAVALETRVTKLEGEVARMRRSMAPQTALGRGAAASPDSLRAPRRLGLWANLGRWLTKKGDQ